jgi:hypothetical protein
MGSVGIRRKVVQPCTGESSDEDDHRRKPPDFLAPEMATQLRAVAQPDRNMAVPQAAPRRPVRHARLDKANRR